MTEPIQIAELVRGVIAGEVRAIARALRVVDDRADGFLALLTSLFPHSGRAYLIGVTGMPGSGKSTLVDRLIEAYRARDQRVAVVAVDPTSPFSGGAILGDRIRMQRHFLDDGVFIRSLATRGALGGLSRSAGDLTRVLDAAGYDVVIVETVGVGQDELEVARLAHTTIVVMAPGMGDDIQAIKAGILEIADVFAVNKADRPGADATMRDLEQMIALDSVVGSDVSGHHRVAVAHDSGGATATAAAGIDAWVPPVVKTVAAQGVGTELLVEACDLHRAHVRETDAGSRREAERRDHELRGIFRDTLYREAEERVRHQLTDALDAIADRTDDPYSVSTRLVQLLLGEGERP